MYGHENKCAYLHGHNYRVHFQVGQHEANSLDDLGRVIDFGVIKDLLCEWVEEQWDHKFLVWEHDPMATSLAVLSPKSVVLTPFNPTAENMAYWLLHELGPQLFRGWGVRLLSVTVEETRKCSAQANLE